MTFRSNRDHHSNNYQAKSLKTALCPEFIDPYHKNFLTCYRETDGISICHLLYVHEIWIHQDINSTVRVWRNFLMIHYKPVL